MITYSLVDYMSRKRDYSEEVLTSEFAYKILREIHLGNSTNPTKIAESLDSTYYSVNNYMKGFRSLEFIRGKKKGKKKFYSIDFDKIYEFWIEELTKSLERQPKKQKKGIDKLKSLENIEDSPIALEGRKKVLNSAESIENIEDNYKKLKKFSKKEKYREFFTNWVEQYITAEKEGKVSDMIFEDLREELKSQELKYHLIIEKSDTDIEYPEYLSTLQRALETRSKKENPLLKKYLSNQIAIEIIKNKTGLSEEEIEKLTDDEDQ